MFYLKQLERSVQDGLPMIHAARNVSEKYEEHEVPTMPIY